MTTPIDTSREALEGLLRQMNNFDHIDAPLQEKVAALLDERDQLQRDLDEAVGLLRKVDKLGRTWRKATNLVGPSEYYYAPQSRRAWNKALYGAGREILTVTKAFLAKHPAPESIQCPPTARPR